MGALSWLFLNMASWKKRGLTGEEIMNLVFDSDQESDIYDDDNALLDNGDCQTDESGSDLTEAIFEEATLPFYYGRINLPATVSPIRLPRHILANKVEQNLSRLCLVCKAKGENSES